MRHPNPSPICSALIALLLVTGLATRPLRGDADGIASPSAASVAFAPASTGNQAPNPDCLYCPAAPYGFTPFERRTFYTDNAGDQRDVRFLIRQPLGAPAPMPVVRWLSSAGLAFLDGHVRQLPAASQWLRSGRIEAASGGVAEWQHK